MCEIWMCGFQGTQNPIRFPVTMAKGIHLFPCRTQKLSLSAPMVLGWRRLGRVGRCRIPWKERPARKGGSFFSYNQKVILPNYSNQCAALYLVRIFPATRSAGCRQEKSHGRVGGSVEEHIPCHKGAYTGKSGIGRKKSWYHRNLKR